MVFAICVLGKLNLYARSSNSILNQFREKRQMVIIFYSFILSYFQNVIILTTGKCVNFWGNKKKNGKIGSFLRTKVTFPTATLSKYDPISSWIFCWPWSDTLTSLLRIWGGAFFFNWSTFLRKKDYYTILHYALLHSASQHLHPSAPQPLSLSAPQHLSPSAPQPLSSSASQPLSPSASQLLSLSAPQPFSPSASQLLSLSAPQPLSPSASQALSISAPQPLSLSTSQPLSPQPLSISASQLLSLSAP